MGNHGDPLAVGTGKHFGTHQRIVTEQRHHVDLDPAIGVGQFLHGLLIERGCLSSAERKEVVGVGQRLPGGPGFEQSRLSLGRSLGGATAGLLFELHRVQHQQQGGDESDGVDRPEFVFQRDIAKPGTHGGLL
ncbi:hypothetical protein D3C86_983180 [compost metagenome]